MRTIEVTPEVAVEYIEERGWESYLDIVVSDNGGDPLDFETVESKVAFLVTTGNMTPEEVLTDTEAYEELYANSYEAGASEV